MSNSCLLFLSCYHEGMHGILQFNVAYEGGAYTVEAVIAPIVMFGCTFEELSHNIYEVVDLFFRDERPEALGFIPSPSILTSFELPSIAYGGQA
jgi:hypothetical protein